MILKVTEVEPKRYKVEFFEAPQRDQLPSAYIQEGDRAYIQDKELICLNSTGLRYCIFPGLILKDNELAEMLDIMACASVRLSNILHSYYKNREIIYTTNYGDTVISMEIKEGSRIIKRDRYLYRAADRYNKQTQGDSDEEANALQK